MSDAESAAVESMRWVQTADARQDARAELAKEDKPSLIAFSGRLVTFPGLTEAQYERIKDRVQYEFAKGSGDVLHGPTHKALRKQLRDYVRQYNQAIHAQLTQD